MTKEKKSKRTVKEQYVELDVDKLKNEYQENSEEAYVDGYTRSVYETKTIISGTIKEMEIYPIFLKKDIPEELRTKRTAKAMKNLNDKNARKLFTRRLNHNFGLKDYWITLTYSNKNQPKDKKEAQKNIREYFRKLNRLYSKKQLPQGTKKSKKKLKTVKYMYIIEQGKNGNWHYHIVMNSILGMEEVEEAWKHGRRNNIRFLYPDEKHLTGLADYLTKEPRGGKRWGCSKNLKTPIPTTNKSKFSKKKINDMNKDYELLRSEMEKANPGYRFISGNAKLNDINGKIYIHAMMIKI